MNNDSALVIRNLDETNIWDYENAFYWFSNPTRINKLIAHYELYKSIVNLPGDIFELGVYKAASLIRFATFRNVLENDFSRKIVGFDVFGKFPVDKLSLDSDFDFIKNFEKQGGDGLSLTEVDEILKAKSFKNIILNKGNVFETLPEYLDQFPSTRLSLLHLDMDVREPTSYALDMLYDRLVPNGLIIFDDYGSVAGESDAVDEFLSKHNLKIQKMPHYFVPAFVRKVL